MMVKLTQGVDLTNMLTSSFYATDPKSIKIQSSDQYVFALLESGRVKASCKHDREIDPRSSLTVNLTL
jgi:hypothetical protein